ncbi:MAG: DUF4864 domain-containing protein [Pseudoruegeria sp.]
MLKEIKNFGGALLLLAVPVAAQESTTQETISNQIIAFQSGAIGEAFEFASPSIQGLFGSPENFGQMVQSGYPMVWEPGQVTFLEADDLGHMQTQIVMIKDQSGVLHFLEYQLVIVDGNWRINGVRFLPAPGAGA